MQIDTTYVVQAGDVALTRSARGIRDGNDVKIAKEGTEIVRRQSNCNWLLLVDNPYGAEPRLQKRRSLQARCYPPPASPLHGQ